MTFNAPVTTIWELTTQSLLNVYAPYDGLLVHHSWLLQASSSLVCPGKVACVPVGQLEGHPAVSVAWFIELPNFPAGQEVQVPVDEGWVAQLLEVIIVVGVFVPYVPGRHGRVM